MNKAQLVRLTLVLFLPLLGIGFWLAEEEYVFPHHHVTYCVNDGNQLNCYTRQVAAREKFDREFNIGGVRLWGALLLDGFHHSVIQMPSIAYTNQAGEVVNHIPDSGIPRFIDLSSNSKESARSWCDISMVAEREHRWMLSCHGAEQALREFTFVNEKTSEEYKNALKEIVVQTSEYETKEKYAFVASVVTPLIAYFLLVAAYFLLRLIFRFVAHGAKTRSLA